MDKFKSIGFEAVALDQLPHDLAKCALPSTWWTNGWGYFINKDHPDIVYTHTEDVEGEGIILKGTLEERLSLATTINTALYHLGVTTLVQWAGNDPEPLADYVPEV